MDSSQYSQTFRALNDSDRESHQSNFSLPFTDICTLSNYLFKELSSKFELLFSGSEEARLQLGFSIHPEELILLLRCCLAMLRLLKFNQGFLLEKCKILHAILERLCSSDLTLHISGSPGDNEKHTLSFRRSFSRQCVYYASDYGFTKYVEEYNASMFIVEEAGSPIPFLCSLLEVFADELLLHRDLRQYFRLADSVSSSSEKLFMCYSSHGDSDDVMEVICAHFLLSLSDEQASRRLHNASLWWHAEDLRTSELSLAASLALLGSSVISSAPKLIQAHIISMIARTIGIDIAPSNTRLDLSIMNCYISALERSILLYTQNISTLQVCHDLGVYTGTFSSVRPTIWKRGWHPSFELYIRPVTRNRVNNKIADLACSQYSSVCNSNSIKKSDFLNASISYMKDNQSVLDESSREEMLSILNCIISIIAQEVEDTATHNCGYLSFEEIHLLSSVLKLVGSSLLQTVWFMRQNGSSESHKMLNDYSCCKEYEFLVGIIGFFQQSCVSQHVQNLFPEAMGSSQNRHKESKLMFMHFVGLLLFSFERELELLWKGCLFTMMTLMNLFIFEEGNLDALKELLGLGNKSLFTRSSINKVSQIQVFKDSSLVVASAFQKIQTLHLSKGFPSRYETGKQGSPSETSAGILLQGAKESVEGIVEKTCNGELFMKSTPELHWKPSDIDDLADFIECKQDKDYSKWLKGREKYRKWKRGKTTVVRREQKKSFRLLLGE